MTYKTEPVVEDENIKISMSKYKFKIVKMSKKNQVQWQTDSKEILQLSVKQKNTQSMF